MMETPDDSNVVALKEDETPAEQVPQTQADTSERTAAVRDWGRHEGTRLLLDWVKVSLQERQRWLANVMQQPQASGDIEDVLLSEAARARAIGYRAEAMVYSTLEQLLVGTITRARMTALCEPQNQTATMCPFWCGLELADGRVLSCDACADVGARATAAANAGGAAGAGWIDQ